MNFSAGLLSEYSVDELNQFLESEKSREDEAYQIFCHCVSGMSKVEIEIPDDRWFRGEWDFRPQDKQLCVVIPKWCDGLPMIAQYRRKSVDGVDCFHILGTMSLISRFQPSDIKYQAISHIRFWKPLWLPEDVEERVLAEIEKWFEEDE